MSSNQVRRRCRSAVPSRKAGVLAWLVVVALVGTSPVRVRAQEPDEALVDYTPCYNALFLADRNKDARISTNEYVAFLSYSQPEPAMIEEMDAFESLPSILQDTFWSLTCLCREVGATEGTVE